ncbi:MAG: aspartyl/glutamyl-tRNA amidotransferase subunit A [Chloroflexi bacterium]|nr:aspartyl/glutamyl-tRNA amidotransferase subunit A [Chloroflexota bacterium]
MNQSDLPFLTIAELAPLIENGDVSPVVVTQAVLERIEALDGRLNAYLTVLHDEACPEPSRRAMSAAREVENAISTGGYLGPLHGVPISLKDLFWTQGVRTTAGSKILADFVPHEDAHSVARLKAAGAVIVGKTNLHEFAYGVTTINPHYGTTRNPWDAERIAGGSSGGSAAAVAAGLCTAAMGTDTGGSIRIPAALCGIVGLKPTYGRVSRHGVVPLAWTMDHVGPMTRSVRDAALMLNVVAGHDPRDPASTNAPVPGPSAELRAGFTAGLDAGVRGLRLGVPQHFYFDDLDAEVEECVRVAIDVLGRLGGTIEEVALPRLEYAPAVYWPISISEAAAYHRDWLINRPQDYGDDVRERMEPGLLVPAVRYLQAQRARRLIADDFRHALREVDVLLAPTTPIPAPRLDEAGTPEVRSSLLRLTSPANLAGLPALSVPCGFTGAGLPVGLQIIGRAFDEATVLRVGHAYETTAAVISSFLSEVCGNDRGYFLGTK